MGLHKDNKLVIVYLHYMFMMMMMIIIIIIIIIIRHISFFHIHSSSLHSACPTMSHTVKKQTLLLK